MKRRLQGFLCNPLGGFRRDYAGNEMIQGCGAGVNVSPGALFAMPVILFPRRISWRQNRRHSTIALPQRLAGSAEIEQDCASDGGYVYVLGFDVAMQKTFGMNFT